MLTKLSFALDALHPLYRASANVLPQPILALPAVRDPIKVDVPPAIPLHSPLHPLYKVHHPPDDRL